MVTYKLQISVLARAAGTVLTIESLTPLPASASRYRRSFYQGDDAVEVMILFVMSRFLSHIFMLTFSIPFPAFINSHTSKLSHTPASCLGAIPSKPFFKVLLSPWDRLLSRVD
jgi:hypothetical protein